MTSTTAQGSLRELVDAAGMPSGGLADVELFGEDPVVPTRYRVGAAGAASFAAVGLAAAELWALKTGRRQRIRLDVRHGTIGLRSNAYIKVESGASDLEFRDRFTGIYPTRNGRWIYLHCNFPNLRDVNLGVLGNPKDAEEVTKATMGWDGLELETAIFAAGGCCGYVRTHAEWDAHPHSAAVALQPILEITKIGEAPVEPLPAGPRPLSGIRALDLTRVIAGPACSRTFAEHGADVLKITRQGLSESGILDADSGFGKRAANLDLRQSADAERLRELIRTSDMFVQSYRPGTLARRGFGPEDVARLRPGTIYVTLSAWGASGPWSTYRGFDTVVQAINGMAHTQGAGGKPQHQPVAAIDHIAGNLMALGGLEALRRRATIGGSWFVRVSLARSGKFLLDRGMLEPGAIANVPADLPAEELERLCGRMDSPFGRLQFLKPIISMSETQPTLDSPPLPLGSSPAEWQPRSL